MRHIYKSTLLVLCAALLLPAPARAQDFTTGLVGHWTLDETSGTTAVDSAGNNNGTLWGGMDAAADTSSGKIGRSFDFDATDDYITMGSPASLDDINVKTLSAWIFPRSSGENQGGRIFYKRGGGSDGWQFNLTESAGNIALNYSHGFTGGGGGWRTAYGAIIPNQWNFVAVSYDRTSTANDPVFYINGAAASTTETQAPVTAAYSDASYNFQIGGQSTGFNIFDGFIDDGRLYNRALSAEDIAALYQARNPGQIRYNENNRAAEYFDGGAWVPMGRQNYVPNAITFDGTDYLDGFPTAADSGQLSGSFWFRRTGSGNMDFVGKNGDAFEILIYGDTLDIIAENNAGTEILEVHSPVSITDSDWHHVMFSFDLTDTNRRHLYIDGVSGLNVVDYINDTMNFGPGGGGHEWGIGADISGSAPFIGDLADFWIDTGTYIDLSDPENRLKFYDNGRPVYLGASGEKPTGTAPEVFLSGNTSTWHANDGTGGGFTENGTLTDAFFDPGSILVPPTEGLIGHWKLDESSGTSATDSSGNGNTGTLTSGAVFAPSGGKIAGGVSLDGNNDLVTISNESNFDFEHTDPFSISAWIYRDTTNTEDDILEKVDVNQNWKGYALWITEYGGAGDDQVTWNLVGDTAGNLDDIALQGSTTISAGTWYHVVGTYNGNSDVSGMNLYINGVEVGSVLYNGTPTDILNNNPVLIGDDTTADTCCNFDGMIDDLRIYDRELSETEVLQLYYATSPNGGNCSNPIRPQGSIIYNTTSDQMQFCNGEDWVAMGPPGNGGGGCSNPAGSEGRLAYNSAYNYMQYCEGSDWVKVGLRGVPEIGLVGHWKFDETSGSTAYDSSGNGNDLTVTAASPWATGKAGGAFYFNGASEGAQRNASINQAILTTSSTSVAFWIRVDSFPGSGGAVLFVDYAGGGSYQNIYASAGSPDNIAFVNNSGGNVITDTSTNYQTGQWYHVVAVYDDADNTLKFYNNGALIGSTGEPCGGCAWPSSIDDVIIGFGNGFTAAVDDLRIYNRALSAGEIYDLYNKTGGN